LILKQTRSPWHKHTMFVQRRLIKTDSTEPFYKGVGGRTTRLQTVS